MATFKKEEKFLPVNIYRSSTPELGPLCILKINMGLTQSEIIFDCRFFRTVRRKVSDTLSSIKSLTARSLWILWEKIRNFNVLFKVFCQSLCCPTEAQGRKQRGLWNGFGSIPPKPPFWHGPTLLLQWLHFEKSPSMDQFEQGIMMWVRKPHWLFCGLCAHPTFLVSHYLTPCHMKHGIGSREKREESREKGEKHCGKSGRNHSEIVFASS